MAATNETLPLLSVQEQQGLLSSLNSSSSSAASSPLSAASVVEQILSANITSIGAQLLTSTISTLVEIASSGGNSSSTEDPISGYVLFGNDSVITEDQVSTNGSTGSGGGKLRTLGKAPAVLGTSETAAENAESGEGSSGGVLAAWVGLGVLLVGIVFILGFVFVYDRIIKKRYNKKEEEDPEENGSGDQVDGSKGSNKKPENPPATGKIPEPGQTEFKTAEEMAAADEAEEREAETEEAERNQGGGRGGAGSLRGSKTNLNNNNRKRQEKQDETNQVELKPL